MDTCDVLIIGGGPAGSTCARALRQAGVDAIVLDKATFPRDKVCAGWITPAVIDELELDVDDYRRERVFQPITGFRTGLLGGPDLLTSFGRAVSYGIRRREFDHYLLERAGARLKLETPLEDLRRDGDRWIVNDEISAGLIIGAGGHFCPVARLMSKSGDSEETVVLAQEIEFEMTADELSACRVEEQIPELYFCDDLRGYAWCFRKGNVLNIGLGREGDKRLSPQVEVLYVGLIERGRIPPGRSPRFHGHAYRLYVGPPRKVLHPGVLLIGDAAGLAYPQSGEGIRPAIESGLLAAATIVETPRSRRDDLATRFQRRMSDRFGEPARRGGLGSIIPEGWKQFAARKLLASPWFSRRVLLERWFLHQQQPPLETRHFPCEPVGASQAMMKN